MKALLLLVVLPIYAVWIAVLLAVAAWCMVIAAALYTLAAIGWILWFLLSTVVALQRRYSR